MDDTIVASLMVCVAPRKLGGRLVLSCYDGVWEAVEQLPEELRSRFTDDLGNTYPQYGGFLQLVDLTVLTELSKYGLYSCFRCVSPEWVKYTDSYPPHSIYASIKNTLCFVGWDVATGNGWRSASTDGCFPIDPFSGEIDEQDKINQFGLIRDASDCIFYCKESDITVPDYAPWFPVAVYVDSESYQRLTNLMDGEKGSR